MLPVMPYLSHFETDLFVSYGHIDNVAASESEQEWIDRFHRDLESRVTQYLGTPITIWRDKYLAGNQVFSKEIEVKLQGSAALIPILSPRYLTSDWCLKELQAFLLAVERNGGIQIGTKTRVFKVIKTLIDIKKQPDFMQQLLGYEFYRLDERGRPKELPDWDPAPDAQKMYLSRLDDLAYDIHLLLKDLKTSEQVDRVSPPNAKPAEGSVYLAETTTELTECRDQLRRELLAFGYRVLPDERIPEEAKALRQKVEAWLESSSLSLHLIGSPYGLVPEGDGETRSTVWLQQEIALERQAKGNFQCVLWTPPGIQITDPRQREFLEHLQGQLKSETKFELLKTPLQDLKNFIFEKLKSPPQPRAAPAGTGTRVYLMCEQRDAPAVNPIRNALNQLGMQVDLPLWQGDQSEIRLDHEATLQDCDAVLIYHGTASEAWVRAKIRDLRRARGLGRSRPFIAQGIYVGPEPTDAKKLFDDRDFIIIRNFGEFAPACLNSFIKATANSNSASA